MWVEDQAAATGFFEGVDLAGCEGLDCGVLGSAAFSVVDPLEAELSFTVAVGLDGSGFLVAADAVAGFFATAGSGRLTSFFAATALGGCAAVVLPVEGAVVTLEVVVLAVALAGGLTVDVVGLDAVEKGRDVEGPVAGLVVFEAPAAPAFAVVEVLGFGAVDAAALLAVAVVFGRATLTVSATGLFLGMPFTAVALLPFVAVAAATDVVLAGPTGFLSGTLDWFLAMAETAAPPTGLLGTAPAAEAFAVVAGFLTAAADVRLEDFTPFTVRCEAAPGWDPEAPAGLAAGWNLVATAFGLTLGSAATGLESAFGAAMGAASLAASSGCDGACSVMLSCDEEGSATAAASVGSGVSMVSPSGFIPSYNKVQTPTTAACLQGPGAHSFLSLFDVLPGDFTGLTITPRERPSPCPSLHV